MAHERVLLVDDERDFVEVLKERLEARGLRVQTAFDGQEALERVRSSSFDAIILDLKMPGMDGIETLEHILELDRDAQVILLTGHGTVPTSVEAVKKGAADFIEKPAPLSELMSRIGQASAKRMVLLEEHSMEKIEEILNRKPW